ncbi:LLM class flavin-dependent oxidoreductase [Leucobacter sp. wl10]|uniref:LLM class flavin-dependent oxidoreductase n=1 Tax=Leucobacter sp. wl10 TaxID=2304677 RepID=UPI001F096A64|nr:LLM class flavin-dependent oxidoreductase [Leucobacter sp. wl10]
MAQRQMHLVGMVNPPTSQYAENWRDPLGRADWLSGRFHADLARTLERGLFDLVFFADALAVPEDREGGYASTLRTAGKGSIYLDPIALVSLAAGATSRIGLGATVSTSFVPPYAIARQLLSVDHLSGGRAAWNAVARAAHAAPQPAGAPRAHAGGVVAARPGIRGALGRSGLRDRRHRGGHARAAERAAGAGPARPRPRSRLHPRTAAPPAARASRTCWRR